jgi:beta-glucanase (GH16 family)
MSQLMKACLRPLLLCGALVLPGSLHAVTFQAEDYSQFNDTTPGNAGGAYRNDDVDIEVTSDTGGGHNVGWIAAGEWLTFPDLAVAAGGTHTIRLRVASPSGGRVTVDLNGGALVLGTVDVPATGGWQAWQTLSFNANIDPGNYTLGLYAHTAGWNLNWIEVVPNTPPASGALVINEHCNYSGWAVGLDAGSYTTAQLQALGANNNAVSSLLLQPGYEVELFAEDNFSGSSLTVTASDDCLTDNGFNDLTRSLIVRPTATDNLVWADEFDSIDSASWSFETGGGGWGNNELQYYTNGDNARIEHDPQAGSNVLVLEARQENPANYNCWYGQCTYTSTRLISRDKQSFQYGRIEARMKLPQTQGIWPAFWALGNAFGTDGWPQGGEIDIMEHVGYEPTLTHGALHGPGYSGNTPITGTHDVGESVDANYHLYAIEWDSQGIRWFVDDQQFYQVTRAQVEAYGEWVYDQPFWLLLNVAVGGNWPGSPDGSSSFPQRLYVDYVRVYGDDSAPCVGSRAYQNQPQPLPGKVEAEYYNEACANGQAYSDADPENRGGALRTDGVDLEATTDNGGGFNLGWTETGEWLDYTVNVTQASAYDVSVRAASQGFAGALHFSLNGQPLGNTINLRNTGGWQAFRSVSGGQVNLPAGQHTLRLHVDSGNFNLNYIQFAEAGTLPDPDGVHTADRSRGEWTLITVPDTQHYSQNRANAPIAHMHAAFDWIAAKKDQLNVQFVQGLGDITEAWDQRWEWDNASAAWYKLNGQVPFMPVPGNHDSLARLNEYFPVSMFANQPWYGGDSGGIQNNYGTLNLGDGRYLFLHLQSYDQFSNYDPTGINWAKGVLANHPNHKVLLATHDTWETDHVKNQLLTKFDNIAMSNAGHSCQREAHYVTQGPQGGVSNNFVIDYQCDAQEVMKLRYYLFKPLEDKVEYYTFSPITGEFEADASSQGSFELIQQDP